MRIFAFIFLCWIFYPNTVLACSEGDLFEQHACLLQKAINEKNEDNVRGIIGTPYANANTELRNGMTPLKYAINNYFNESRSRFPEGLKRIVEALIELGADPTISYSNGTNAIDILANLTFHSLRLNSDEQINQGYEHLFKWLEQYSEDFDYNPFQARVSFYGTQKYTYRHLKPFLFQECSPLAIRRFDVIKNLDVDLTLTNFMGGNILHYLTLRSLNANEGGNGSASMCGEILRYIVDRAPMILNQKDSYGRRPIDQVFYVGGVGVTNVRDYGGGHCLGMSLNPSVSKDIRTSDILKSIGSDPEDISVTEQDVNYSFETRNRYPSVLCSSAEYLPN